MIKLIQGFIDSPTPDTVQSLQNSAEQQAKTIFTT
jgi:multiple sugar transport system substrate-binding protein